MNDLLMIICDAPDTQIDKRITDKIKLIIGQDVDSISDCLKEALNESAQYALASDFGMMVMHKAWELASDKAK